MKAGRPKSFNNVKELNDKIESYLMYQEEKELPITMLSFYVYCDICKDTGSLYVKGEYDDENNSFSDALKKLRAKCEAYAESQLYSNRNTAGIIFSLKNNYNWRDKQEIDMKIEDLTVTIANDEEE